MEQDPLGMVAQDAGLDLADAAVPEWEPEAAEWAEVPVVAALAEEHIR